MKKFLSTLIFVFALMAALCVVSFAESEKNDSYSTADIITLGESMSGTISNCDDVDYYKMVAPANGKITVQFLHTYVDSGDDWNVDLYYYSNGGYHQLSCYNIALRDNEKISLPYIGAKKNGVYYIKVEGYAYKKYTIATSFTESAYFEKELNNAYANATSMTLGKTYSGVINDREDKDFYKITSPANGKIDIKFNHSFVDSGDNWNIYIYYYTNGEYHELSSWGVALRDNEKITLPYIGAKKNGVYYVKVEQHYYNVDVIGRNYSISTSFTESAYFEKELNDSYSTATSVSLNKTYNGVINNYYDDDYYKIVAPFTGTVTVKFGHSFVDSYDRWLVRVYSYYDGEYKELGYNYVNLNSSKTLTLQSIGVVKGRAYFIRVENDYNDVIGKNYTVSFNVSVGKPSPSVGKITTSSINIKWAKVSGATGYEVYKYTASNKKYTLLGSTTGTSYTHNELKAGTKYSYAVKAYKTISGKKYYSGYSKIVNTATLTAAPAISKIASTKSKTATVTWKKVTGASKYIVYKSTDNKKWTKAATTTKLTYTLSNLTGGKKIYVKVIAVNAYGKNSAASAVKSVTVKK